MATQTFPAAMGGSLLVLNAGSSSLKFSLYHGNPDEQGEPLAQGQGSLERREEQWVLSFTDRSGKAAEERWPLPAKDGDALERLLPWIEARTGAPLVAAGHRVVHGGLRQEVAALVDETLLIELQALTPIAPQHQPLCLAPIRFLASKYPGLPQVACFDTAFHHTLDPLETLYGLPRRMTEEGVRRYGFHGLSYEYIAGVLGDYDSAAAAGRTIVAHLGNGASLCALHNGRSRATSMGFTTLDGLLMGSRPGHLDPGILLYLMRERAMSAQALEHLLYHECGLLGVSGGIASDMRTLLASDQVAAREAVSLYIHNVVREIGSFAAVLGGLDALVFTGGIGEHAAPVRAAILRGCAWLGLELDEEANQASASRLSRPHSRVRAWMIPTDEDRVIARYTLKLLPTPLLDSNPD